MTVHLPELCEPAHRLLEACDPYVALEMPNCVPKAVNHVHAKVIGGTRLTVKTVAAFQSRLAQASDSNARCYCEDPLEAIVALAPNDCVFDDLLASEQGVDFEFLYRPNGNPTSRRYVLARVFVAKLPKFKENTTHLEARLVNLPGFEVLIETLDRSSRRVAFGYATQRDAFWESRTFQISKGDLDAQYRNVYRKLFEAHERLVMNGDVDKVSRDLRDAVASFGNDQTAAYAGFKTLVDVILNATSSRQTLAERIRSVYERLWDAPVAARKTRKILNGLFADRDWVHHVRKRMPVADGRALARATMTRGQLDSLDAISGMIRLPRGYRPDYSVVEDDPIVFG